MKHLYYLLALMLTLTAAARAAELTLAWDPVPGAASYRLYCALQASGQAVSSVSVGGADNSVQVTGLADGTAYAFHVTASDVEGIESLPSDECDAATAAVIPTVTVDPGIHVATVRGVKQGTASFRLSSAAPEAIKVPYCLYGTAADGRSYGLIYCAATIPAGATSAQLDIVAPTAANSRFFARAVYLILEASNDPSYQASQAVLPVTVR